MQRRDLRLNLEHESRTYVPALCKYEDVQAGRSGILPPIAAVKPLYEPPVIVL